MKRFISTMKHSPEFIMGMNRIGSVIPPDAIFSCIQKVLKEDADKNPSHSNDFKFGMKSLADAAQSQGKTGLPKKSLENMTDKDGIEIIVPSYDRRESLAYLVQRSTANFAACQTIFKEIQRRVPDFNPSSILDWGTGTGSVFWSAKNVWENINQAVGVDLSGNIVKNLMERFND